MARISTDKQSIEIPCTSCNGKGVKTINIRSARDVLVACQKPGATQNELDAARWIGQLLEIVERTDG